MIPSCDQTGVPIHFHSSTTSGSASWMSLRILLRVSPRQSLRSAILSEIRADADLPWFVPDFFMVSGGICGCGAQIGYPFAGESCFLFVFFVAPGLKQSGVVPALHGGQSEQPIDVCARLLRQAGGVGLRAEGHRREESIDRGELRPGQERAPEPAQALAPKLVDSRPFALERRSDSSQSNTKTAVHRAGVPDVREPRVHLGRSRACPGACARLRGPRASVQLGDVLDDGK